jgi:preprotein translocase subunit SecA
MDKEVARLLPTLRRINALEKSLEALSDDALLAKTDEFKERIANSESLDQILPEAFAAVREAAKRTISQRHFDVQLIGGIVLHQGKIAEMKTGEGKTLVATLAAYLNALGGKGVHLVTVNDYLAQRDCEWMGPVYAALGVTCAAIGHELSKIYAGGAVKRPFPVKLSENLRDVTRTQAYRADITYGTNSEFGFDYLRDNMAKDLSELVQRPHNFAIIDEVDSILIDEARTPLIIAYSEEEETERFRKFATLVSKLTPDKDFEVNEEERSVILTDDGIKKVEKMLGISDLFSLAHETEVFHLNQALRAGALFKKDRDYIVKEGEVVIVDEFTGRLMFGRRFTEGLHQAIEAKEEVPIKAENKTLATVSIQNFFRLYKKISGMTGTAKTASQEFREMYRLEVTEIPTNRPMIRKDLPDRVFRTENEKDEAIVETIRTLHFAGQPILIGTKSVARNEKLSKHLSAEGVPHTVLNAKNHEKEAEIIAQAGKPGAVTLATNIAGRGVDILLGGNPQDEDASKKVKGAGGLFVLGTEYHDARRIDDQLKGRSGRQGDPGITQFYLSLEDDIVRIYLEEDYEKWKEKTHKNSKFAEITDKRVHRLFREAQEEVEHVNYDARRQLFKYDSIIDLQRRSIYGRRRELLDAETLEATLLSSLLSVLREAADRLKVASVGGSELVVERDPVYARLRQYFPTLSATVFEEAISNEVTPEGVFKRLTLSIEEGMAKLRSEIGGEEFKKVLCLIALSIADRLWIEHLTDLEDLKEGIALEAVGQRDPLVEFKIQAAKRFETLVQRIEDETAKALARAIPV